MGRAQIMGETPFGGTAAGLRPQPPTASSQSGILSRRLLPDRRPSSHHRRGIKLIINHAHLAMVLRVKQEMEDAA